MSSFPARFLARAPYSTSFRISGSRKRETSFPITSSSADCRIRSKPATTHGSTLVPPLAKRADRIDFECVVRGYLAGSGWKEYRSTGGIAGHELPVGLRQAAQLPEPIFTPAMKNDIGHDENITVERLRDLVGADLASQLERASISSTPSRQNMPQRAGMLLADTKFEFGMIQGQLTVIDEMLTPDSSRYWDASTHSPGREPESFDKQYVRNWLDSTGWNHEPPAPVLPDDVITGTQQRYVEAFQRLTGHDPVF
ncbi:MAG: phosphoribosylaminoimidazolesuccinocarboxamide synthase [Thermomicrobiales bacterium]